MQVRERPRPVVENVAPLVLVVSAAHAALEWDTPELDVVHVDEHAEALDLLSRAPADFVLVGVGADGDESAMAFLERAKALSTDRGGAPLVLLASTEGVDVERAYRAGATDVWFSNAGPVVLERRLRFITDMLRALGRLSVSTRRLERARETAPAARWEWDLATQRVRWSRELRALLETSPRGRSGVESILEMVHPSERVRVEGILEHVVETGQGQRFDHWAAGSGGSKRVVEQFCELETARDGTPFRIRGFVVDVTTQRLAEREIHDLANYDRLTGLPNRLSFLHLLERAVRRNERSASATAVALVDVDGFAAINESFGDEASDELLRQLATRLTAHLRKSDFLARENTYTVAHRGGDEFLVLMEEVKAPIDAAAAARRILGALREPFLVGEQEVPLSVSIGISLTFGALASEELVRQAELAMYAAKRDGRSRFRFFDDTMTEEVLARFDMERQLRGAIGRDELVVFYQPLVNASTREFAGVEALVRWRHPTLGTLAADDFVPLAEDSDLIVTLGRWVLETACRQIAAWRMAGHGDVRLSVNLSSRELRAPGFVAHVARSLEEAGMRASQLELELTERSVVHDDEETMQVLRRLKSMGIRLAVDDFGTGQTTFHYLKNFPLDTLKIDKSFTRGIGSDDKDAAIIRALLAMARRLNLNVVAEGVENETQMSFLGRHRCNEVQGFLFGRPVAGPALTASLERRLLGRGDAPPRAGSPPARRDLESLRSGEDALPQ